MFELFRANYHGLAFASTFRRKVAKGTSFREKARRNVHLAKCLNFFEQTTMVRRLGQLFGKKLQKVPHFTIKHEKSSIWPKVSTFLSKLPWLGVLFNFSAKSCKKCLTSRESMKNRLFCGNLQLVPANYHGSAFGSTCRQKVPHFTKRNEKSSMWRKLATSSSKLPWFGVWVNFSAKSCKNCLISGKSTKNR